MQDPATVTLPDPDNTPTLPLLQYCISCWHGLPVQSSCTPTGACQGNFVRPISLLNPASLPPTTPSNVKLDQHTQQRQDHLENWLKVGCRPIGPGIPGPATERLIPASADMAAAAAACTASAGLGRFVVAAAGWTSAALQVRGQAST